MSEGTSTRQTPSKGTATPTGDAYCTLLHTVPPNTDEGEKGDNQPDRKPKIGKDCTIKKQQEPMWTTTPYQGRL